MIMSRFNEPEKKWNLTQNFGTGFKGHDQNVEIGAWRLFSILWKYEKVKNKLAHNQFFLTFIVAKTFKKVIRSPKHLKN